MMDYSRFVAEMSAIETNGLPLQWIKFVDSKNLKNVVDAAKSYFCYCQICGMVRPKMLVPIPLNEFGVTRTAHIYLDNFPAEIPLVTTDAILRDYWGRKMDEPSHEHHVHGSLFGRTRICFCSSEDWSERFSLWKLVVNIALWHRLYYKHLQTGISIRDLEQMLHLGSPMLATH